MRKFAVSDIDIKTLTKGFNNTIDKNTSNKDSLTFTPQSNNEGSTNPTHDQIRRTAFRISSLLNDKNPKHFPFYYDTVKRLGISVAEYLLHETQKDVETGIKNHSPIHSPARLFNWKAQNFHEQGGVV